MKARTLIEILAGVFLAIFLAGWWHEHELRLHAEAIADAQQKVATAAQQNIKDRDAIQAKSNAAFAAQAAAVQTPQQAAQVIVKFLPAPVAAASFAPGTPPPAQAQIPIVAAADLPAAVQSQLPAAPSYGIFTPDQMQSIARSEISCQATTQDLATCKADEVDLHTQVTAAQKQSAAWETAAKGGTKFHRLLKVGACIGISGGAAWAGSKFGINPATGAAIGAAAGTVVCSLF
jgi:hypothetical protein